MAATKTQDADQISISYGGADIHGFAPDSVIEIEQESNDFEDEVGADGEVSRSKTNDRRATIRIYLMATSDSNDLLSAISNADRKAPNGAGIAPLYVRDRSGRAVYSAAECWVRKPPQVSFKRSAQERVWELRCANLERFDGGN
jgi:hypothetical protein